MVAIATYVVVEPRDRDELIDRLLRSIAKSSYAHLTLEAVDDDFPSTTLDIMINHTDHDGHGTHFFVGYAYEDLEQYVINLTIPPWNNEPASVKLAPHTTIS